MINYPNTKTINTKQEFINYGKRGMNLEEAINITNKYYLETNTAVIHKKPTPIQIIKLDSQKGRIVDAFFKSPSTTDYNGIYKGMYIDFEAKETKNKTAFPLNNIHAHQVEHLAKIIEHGGIGFIIVNFKMLNEIYILDGRIVKKYMDGETSSIPLNVFKNEGVLVPQGYIVTVDYLKAVDQYYFEK